LLLGLFVILAFFDNSNWDYDTVLGAFAINILSTILGIVALSNKYEGKEVAITSIVISSFSFFVLLGLSQLNGISG
jgi:hypothetical protein